MFDWYVKNKLGKGLCLAKWTNSTMHLGIGTNHSCHHPAPHKIPLEEIEADPSALHNSKHKKEQRNLMLQHKEPYECDYCWKLENTQKYSDRILMSKKKDSWPYFNDIIKTDHYDPTMLEVSFSNVCNFKCAYCGPSFSSKWVEEIKTNGPYPTSTPYRDLVDIQIPDREENPYIEAFWKYLPTMYDKLHTLRITGGEPMLSRHTEKLLKYITEHPNKKLTIVINSNLGAPKSIIVGFVEKLKLIESNVKRIEIATSGEAYGDKLEYIRDGLNFSEWLSNCKYILNSLPKVRLSVMCAYNLFSITSYEKFLDTLIELKKEYKRVYISFSYVRDPSFFHVSLAPKEWKHILEKTLIKVKKNFNSETVQRFKFVMSEFDKDSNVQDLKDLKSFLIEYDKRRGKEFLTIFPEYSFIFS